MNESANTQAWPEDSDEELLLRFRDQGDREALERLIHRYEQELYSYLRRYLGDAALAEDAFQATFLQVFLKSGQFEAGRRVRPWLYAVATNQAIDAQRRAKRHRGVSIDRRSGNDEEDVGSLSQLLMNADPAPSSQMEDEERRRWIRSAVEGLPESLRAVIVLVYFQGLKYREAADALDIPVGTIKSRLHAAMTRLNQQWFEGEERRNHE